MAAKEPDKVVTFPVVAAIPGEAICTILLGKAGYVITVPERTPLQAVPVGFVIIKSIT